MIIILRFAKKIHALKETALEDPPARSNKDAKDKYERCLNEPNEMAHVMSSMMIPKIQKRFEHNGVYAILNQL